MSGSLGQIDNMCKYFTLHSGAKILELYEVILASFVTICDILQGWLQPDISTASYMVQRNLIKY
jgi:hypothetical protein